MVVVVDFSTETLRRCVVSFVVWVGITCGWTDFRFLRRRGEVERRDLSGRAGRFNAAEDLRRLPLPVGMTLVGDLEGASEDVSRVRGSSESSELEDSEEEMDIGEE